MRAVAVALLLLALVLAIGCDTPTIVVADYQHIDPPQEWFDLYVEVVQCINGPFLATVSDESRARMRERFDDIRWYRAAVLHYFDWDQATSATGVWVEPDEIIVRDDVLGSAKDEQSTIKHELVHFALQLDNHKSSLFDRCAPAGRGSG